MRTRDFISKYCRYCPDFMPELGCGVEWDDEVCFEAAFHKDRAGKRMVERIAEYFEKIAEKKEEKPE